MKYTAATWGAEGVLAGARVSDKTRIPAPEGPDSPISALSPGIYGANEFSLGSRRVYSGASVSQPSLAGEDRAPDRRRSTVGKAQTARERP